jgi:hypothetical protein
MAKANGFYYMAAGAVYVRKTDSLTWNEVAPPSAGMMPSGLATDGTNIYATYYSGSTYEVYSRSADGLTTAGGWSPAGLKSDGSSVYSIGGLFYVGATGSEKLFAAVQTGTTYPAFDLYYDNGGTFTAVTGSSTQTPVVAASYDTVGGNDWFVSNNSVLKGNESGVTAQTIAVGSTGYGGFKGIYYDTNGLATNGTAALYLTAGSTLLESTDDGSNWTAPVTGAVVPGTTTTLSLTRVTGIYNGAYKALVVGTEKNGYFLYVPATSGSALLSPDPNSNYEASALRNAAISMLYVDPTPVQTTTNDKPTTPSGVQLIFAGGVSNGLWESYYTSSAPSWVQD